MKPIYLINYEQHVPYETITHYYELPFEEEVPVEKIQALLEKEWNIEKLTFRSHFGNRYSFEYTENVNVFYSDEVFVKEEIISVEVSIVLKIGLRYFECKELAITAKEE